tara:strand:+ start:456 stop:1736 length:1281 start_codon:yes stop_codon:yes gene_type:complete
MIKLTNLKNQLVLFFIIILGFIPSPYAINFGFLALNLDRLILGMMAALFILFFLNKKVFLVSKIHIILLIYLLFSVMNNLFMGNLQLMSIYTIIMLLILTSHHIRFETLKIALGISFIGYALWSLYGIIYFYSYGPLIQVPFASILPDVFIKDLGHAEEVANYYNFFPRISFPFGTPPVLSALGAMFFLYFLNEFNFQRKFSSKISYKSIYGLIAASLIVLITVSKTGIAIVIAGLLINFLLNLSWKIHKNFIVMGSISLLLLSYFVVIASAAVDANPIAQFIYQRLFENSEDFDPTYKGGHLYVRLMGTEHFFNLPIFNQLFGIGYLNIEELHYHSSLLTALIETGLIGFFFLVYLLLLPIRYALRELIKPNSAENLFQAKYIISSSACIIVAHLVYEMPYAQFTWLFWAFLLKGAHSEISYASK